MFICMFMLFFIFYFLLYNTRKEETSLAGAAELFKQKSGLEESVLGTDLKIGQKHWRAGKL